MVRQWWLKNGIRADMNWRMDGEFLLVIHALLRHQTVLKLKDMTHHKVTNRLDHSLGVAYRSYKIARRLRWDADAVARAALLHDLFLETRSDIMRLKRGSHNHVHPLIALANARRICALNTVEENIISSHMFLCALRSPRPKFKEAWLVTLVDKWCAVGERTRLITY